MAQPPNRLEALGRFLRSIFLRATVSTGTYQDSFGPQLSDLGGRSRWAVAGTALRVWHDTVLPLIDDLVVQNEKEIYKNWRIRDTTSIGHCWMIGPDREQAYPTIVICCDAKPILKRIMKMLLEEEKIKREGFKVLGAHTKDVRLTATVSSQPYTTSSPDDVLSGARSSCGGQVIADSTGRRATIGGAIMVDGICYALTVAHVFAEESRVEPVEVVRTEELEIYTGDWALGSDADNSEGEEDTDKLLDDYRLPADDMFPSPMVNETEIGKFTHPALRLVS
jgi:hypothetical protein